MKNIKLWASLLKKFKYGEFPGGPVVRIQCFHFHGLGSKPDGLTEISVSHAVQPRKILNYLINYFKGMVQNRSSQSHLQFYYFVHLSHQTNNWMAKKLWPAWFSWCANFLSLISSPNVWQRGMLFPEVHPNNHKISVKCM